MDGAVDSGLWSRAPKGPSITRTSEGILDLLERDLDRSELDNAMRTVSVTVARYAPFLTSFFAESHEPPMLPGLE